MREQTSIQIDPRSQEPAYAQVRAVIRDHIAKGRFKRGQRLPPIRKLCVDLGVAYATVGRAIRSLVEEGLLEARTGAGTRVAPQRTRQLQTIGVVGFASYAELFRNMRYQATMLTQVQDAVIERGKSVVYNQWKPQTPMWQMFNHLEMIDGLIIIGGLNRHAEEVREVLRLGVPAVCVAQAFSDPSIPAVHCDNFGDSRRAIHLLHALRRRRIVLLTKPEDEMAQSERARRDGAIAGLRDLGLPVSDDWVLVSPTSNQIDRLRSLRPHPTALFALTSHGLGAFHEAFRGTPIALGERLLCAAFDENLWHVLGPLGVPHLSIEQPIHRIATEAVSWLLEMIERRQIGEGSRALPCQMVHVHADGLRERLIAPSPW